jgi:hypothetical protein
MSAHRTYLAKLLLALAISLPLLATARSPLAADMGASEPGAAATAGEAEPVDAVAALDAYLRRHAVLLMIRASFDVVPHGQVVDELAAEARRLGANGPSEHDLARLDRDLLAEGSYYLVSLRYLATVGGAIWPADRPERFYVNDALVRLEALQERLIEAVETRADPLPVLSEAQAIHALTEGLAEVPEELDYFARRDAIVEEALVTDGPRADT